MTKLQHFDHDGRVRFVTFSTHRRLPLLATETTAQATINSIAQVRTVFRFKLLGYVIMPEHVHIVIHPRPESPVGRLIGEIKRSSAKIILSHLEEEKSEILSRLYVQRNGITKRAVWLRRCFDHNCRGIDSVIEKIRYCHQNPVTRGLIDEPTNYLWSSAQWYSGSRNGTIEIDPFIGIPEHM